MRINNSIIGCNDLEIGYSHKKKRKVVCSNLDFQLKSGELTCLIGPNGSGKSTLLRTLAGIQKPLRGEVNVNGEGLGRLKRNQKAQAISILLSSQIYTSNMTVFDLVATGRIPYTNWFGNHSKSDFSKINWALGQVGIEAFTDRPMDSLSDGEFQKSLIAKSLAQDTPFVLLDEPTAHLDIASRIEILQNLRKIVRRWHKAIVFSSHDLELALRISDKVWLMDGKGTMAVGAPEELVLEGEINRVFSKEELHFDPGSGSFKLWFPEAQKIGFQASGAVGFWTKIALERNGFDPVENESLSSIKVFIDKDSNQWHCRSPKKEKKFESVAELVEYLNEISKV